LTIYPDDASTPWATANADQAARLLTRHVSLQAHISDQVWCKNREQNFDDNWALIDKQGIILSPGYGPEAMPYGVKRRYEKLSDLAELALFCRAFLSMLVAHPPGDAQYCSFMLYYVMQLVENPSSVINKSVGAFKAWQLLSAELRLGPAAQQIPSAVREDIDRKSWGFARAAGLPPRAQLQDIAIDRVLDELEKKHSPSRFARIGEAIGSLAVRSVAPLLSVALFALAAWLRGCLG